ncbi:MAG TPA: polymer-forming cytoskeletal protein [Candidatus Binatia bacterium]|nr:polymer-forming cytoskeletal protein [Candidatus Binatia bacterium]
MNPRVLPRVVAAVVATAFLIGLAPLAAAQSSRREAAASPSPSPSARAREIIHEVRDRIAHRDRRSASVVISDDAHVGVGEVHDNDIVAISNDVNIEGEVTGDVVVIMGNLEISGTVDGNVVTIMSPVRLHGTASIEENLVNIGGKLTRDEGARIHGERLSFGLLDWVPFCKGGLAGFWKFMYLLKLISLALLFLAILLITALVPQRLSVIAAAFPSRWAMAILAGLLGYCVTIVLGFILICTLIGIPLAIGLFFMAKVVKWIGLASLFFLIGHTLGRNLFKRELTHIAAVLGGFAVYALISLVPIFGGVFSGVMGVLALGISILTRFGSEEGWGKSRPSAPPVAPPPAAPAGQPPIYSPGS